MDSEMFWDIPKNCNQLYLTPGKGEFQNVPKHQYPLYVK